MTASPAYVTLIANTVATVTLDANFGSVSLLNRNGLDEVFFSTDGTTPTVAGNGFEVLPAGVGATATVRDAGTGAVTVVKLISAAATTVAVRGA